MFRVSFLVLYIKVIDGTPINEPDQGVAGSRALIGFERITVLIFENPAKYIQRAFSEHQMQRHPNVGTLVLWQGYIAKGVLSCALPHFNKLFQLY